ncbi:MAG: lysophospholipid acyltransferase family protein [Mucilaginibacter sp.]|uniref:lysophospholipid acyltransferase family protein n=1 Tax=Mucilaginibacter sp. TaxID=1882438 RepID=UPI003267308D
MIKAGLSSIVFFFLYLVSLLPFWFLFLIADVLYVLLYYITGYRRKVVYENLRNSFPEKTEAEIRLLEKQYFKYLGDLIVETIKMISISEKEILRRVYLTNPELIEEYHKQGKSLIAAVGHYCNWEWCVLRFSLIPQYQKIMVYKPLQDAPSNKYYLKVRGRFGVTLVQMRSTLRKLTELRRSLTFTVLAADQTPVRHETQYYTQFLNQQTAVFQGIEKMAIMFNSAIVFGKIKRVKRGFYEYKFVPMVDEPKQTEPYEITNLYLHTLEDMIKEEPQYWLWSHRRWKFKPEVNG